MKKHILMATTALALGFTAPAMAQDDFAGFSDGIVSMLKSQGATVSFDQRNVGTDGSVEFTGFQMASPDGKMTLHADWIKGVPSASMAGQVAFTLSPSASVTIHTPDTGDHIINISNSGLVVTLDGITSGHSAAVLNFSVKADSLGVTSGNPDDAIIKALDINLTNLNQTVSLTQASKLLRGETGISALDLNYDIIANAGQETATTGKLADLKADFQVIADKSPQNIIDYLSGVTTAYFDLSTGASSSTAKITGPQNSIAYSGSSTGSNISLRAENGFLNVSEDSGKTSYSFSEFNVGGMPLPPFDMSLDQFRINLSTPTVNHGSAEPANVEVALRNLVVSESLYSMFDPSQKVTRSPINVVANLDANVLPKIDWSNPQAAMISGNPAALGELQDVKIKELLVTGGGAKITAEGGATIDNSMGFPYPSGKVTVTATGVQALVNGLVAMGLVPQDQAGMMMGMVMAFARPGTAADEFISDIEFSKKGITANGTPLPM